MRDTKGTFHAKMGTIKDRNGMGLSEAKDIKKRWQECTELYKKMGLIKDRNGMDLTEAEDIKKRWQNTQKNCAKKIFLTQIFMMV